jgi:hypothetical protein
MTQIRVKEYRSKNLLLFIEASVILSMMGFDRLYMGCFWSGLAKLILFLVNMGLVFGFVSVTQNTTENDGLYWSFEIFRSVLLFWWVVDFVSVLLNIFFLMTRKPLLFEGPQNFEFVDVFESLGPATIIGTLFFWMIVFNQFYYLYT